MNILNLATTDHGGAGIASLNINELFNKLGHRSLLIVKESRLDNTNVIVIKPTPSKFLEKLILKAKNRFRKLINTKIIHLYDANYFFTKNEENKEQITAQEILDRLTFKPDIIVFHWISNFITSKTIRDLTAITHAKTFWLMMDNAPLTGGCHYPWNCEGFHAECKDCPAILEESKKNIAKNNLSIKKEILPKSLEIISCSEPDYIRAKKSSIFRKNKIHKILLPVDENAFRPIDKVYAKSLIGIDSKKRVLLFGAFSLKNARKGGQYFIEAISLLQEALLKEGKPIDDWIILVLGNVNKNYFSQINFPVKYLGYLNEGQLIKAYQAADVYVSTSIEDSGPLMVNQSIMCGTPIVAFEVGVALDLIHNGKTGYRAKLFDSKDLADGINYILSLSDEKYFELRNNCRKVGLESMSSFECMRQLELILNED